MAPQGKGRRYVRADRMKSNVCYVDNRDEGLIEILFTVKSIAFLADTSNQEINLQGPQF